MAPLFFFSIIVSVLLQLHFLLLSITGNIPIGGIQQFQHSHHPAGILAAIQPLDT